MPRDRNTDLKSGLVSVRPALPKDDGGNRRACSVRERRARLAEDASQPDVHKASQIPVAVIYCRVSDTR